MATVTIKKGSMELVKTDRKNLLSVAASHDGIVFTFKENIHLYNTDQYMPIGTKELMSQTSVNFPTANLEFDLANYGKPVTAELPNSL